MPHEAAVEPENLTAWFPVLRDFAICTVALCLLVYEAAFTTPNQLIIGLLGAVLVAPAVVRFKAKKDEKGDD